MRIRNSTGDGKFARRIKVGGMEAGEFYLNSTIKRSKRTFKPRKQFIQAPNHKRLLQKSAIGLILFASIMTPLNYEVIKPTIEWLNTPYVTTVYADSKPTPTPAISISSSNGQDKDGEEEEIGSTSSEGVEEIIREVFGKHSDKAFKLLECENKSLNPNAVNTAGNTPAGSRDIGVFQINEYWQGVNAKFLFDPELNVRIAWKIYEDSGYSFKMWTCGKKYGI